MLTKRPRIFHPGRSFYERLIRHRIAVEHGDVIFQYGRQTFVHIHENMMRLLKETREALDLDVRVTRIEKLRQLDEAVDYLADEKYRPALDRQHTQSRSPAEPAFLRVVRPEQD